MNIALHAIGAVLFLPFLSSCSADSNDNSATSNSITPSLDPPALKCDDSAVKTAASQKLAEWIDQNIIKGNAIHVSAKLLVNVAFAAKIPSTDSSAFVSADGTSSTIHGDPQGTQRCTVNYVIAFKEADGTLFGGYALNGFTAKFLLAVAQNGPQITLNDAEMLESTLNETTAIMEIEEEREHP